MMKRRIDTFESNPAKTWEEIMKPMIKKMDKYPTSTVEKVCIEADLIRVYVVEEVNENE